MMDIGLRQVADGPTAARHLGVPIAYFPKSEYTAYVRPNEVWLCHPAPAGERWLVTVTAGSDLYLSGDAEGAAIIVSGILLGRPSADPFGPPAPRWTPQGIPAVPVTGGDRITYAAFLDGRLVVAAVPLGVAPPPEFAWCPPAG